MGVGLANCMDLAKNTGKSVSFIGNEKFFWFGDQY